MHTEQDQNAQHVIRLDEFADLVHHWQETRDTARRAKAAADSVERQLLAVVDDADIGTIGGEPVVHRLVERRPGLDLLRLRQARPELWDEFPAERHRVRLKAPPREPQTS